MICQPEIWQIQFVYSHLGTISLIFAVISGGAHIVYYWLKGFSPTQDATFAKMAAGFVLPPAVAMAGAAFDPGKLLGCVTGIELYILVGAVAVIWITWTVLFPKSIEKRRRVGGGRGRSSGGRPVSPAQPGSAVPSTLPDNDPEK